MFRRTRFGLTTALHGAALALAAGLNIGNHLDFRNVERKVPGKPEERTYKPFKKASRGRAGARAASKGTKDRLIADRSSSVRKMQRWMNNGSMASVVRGDAHWKRHKVRRVERQRAENLAKLAAE